MFSHKISQFKQDIVTIHPGEYLISTEDIIISTVLGSCVSVALWDSRLMHGGLNHFMLPGDFRNEDLSKNPSAKYGMYAIELLYNELLKAGSRKPDIVAKVFGGASVLSFKNHFSSIPKGNVDFAMQYLSKENITVIAKDTGGDQARKLMFFTKTGKVYMKRIKNTIMVKKEEEAYLNNIQNSLDKPITLF